MMMMTLLDLRQAFLRRKTKGIGGKILTVIGGGERKDVTEECLTLMAHGEANLFHYEHGRPSFPFEDAETKSIGKEEVIELRMQEKEKRSFLCKRKGFSNLDRYACV